MYLRRCFISFQFTTDYVGALLTPELAEKITTLWQSKGIQKTFERREEFWCLDATPYYLNEGK